MNMQTAGSNDKPASEPVNQVQVDNVYVVGAVIPHQIASEESLFIDAGRSKVDEYIGEPQCEILAPVVLNPRRVSKVSVKSHVG